ncbi:MAG: methylmalonyl-CoA mutase family protein [Candidatus Bipolaricaulota bacterium]|nr:methylmalonyl-CoA mutase family protein [Candidatus Bipolaricaulota bacterium]MCS7274836.1 methylmalonyl-CoA mutase family protein [Candidatus Bipolaricaulota bacterium]MDW8111257.1 methylmalonyl-CoA mutase family protein [Candidatus Bipolaricaulota bacterium]MDW8328607.1 methylmalonyl-CoA mutase family protein [Candidatus Bipolaricaulota bacterium]
MKTQSEKERWERETLEPFLKRSPERRERFITVSNEEIGRLYTPEDIKDLDYERDLGYPGEYPYTRGVYPTMYRGRLWTMRQFAGFGGPEETNQRFKYLLKEGQTGLSTAFDMPTLMGLDSDHPLADGEVGVEGVAVDTLRDFEILFDGIPLDQVSTSFTINPSAPVIYAMYIAIGDQQGVPREKLRGTIQNDMLKEFIAQKEWVVPPRPSVDLIVDVFEFGIRETPKFNLISISGYHIREAGSTAVQELAFTLADGMAYVEAALQRGLDLDALAPQLSFFFNSHNSFFEEIAKFRAARRIWARALRERYGAKNPESWKLRFHTQTAGCTLTEQQPLNNIIRVTIQALAAVLGGTQSLHTNSYDEALALPTEEAVRIALRTQQIIAYESGVADTIDPLAGSYFVEALTNEIERKALEYIRKIERLGNGSILEGVFRGIEQGFFQREIAQAAYEYQKQVESGEQIIVGVNKYTIPKEQDQKVPTLKIDPEVQRRQIERLKRVRQERDARAVERALARLEEAARQRQNTMPYILEAVKAYASVGEIMEVLKKVHGAYREPAMV